MRISAIPATIPINKFSVFVLDTPGIMRMTTVMAAMMSMDAITVKNNFKKYKSESFTILFVLSIIIFLTYE